MEGDNTRIIEFEKWCYKCEFKDVPDDKEPCDICQTKCARLNTHKPLKYKEAKK